MQRVLFTTPLLEHPPSGGPFLRNETSIQALSMVSELYIISRYGRCFMGGEKAESFYKGLCREFAYAPSARLSGNKYIRWFERRWHAQFSFNRDLRFMLEFIDKHDIGVVWFSFASLSDRLMRAIKLSRPNIKMVADTDSVYSRFVLRELPFETDPRRKGEISREGARLEAWEEEMVNLCDVTTGVSDVDAEYYRKLAVDPGRIKIFSNVINLETYKTVPPLPLSFKKPCIYLAGTYGHAHSPMDRAAQWMIEKVLPLIKKDIPEVHFYMVGKGSEILWGNLKDQSITVTGKLPSVLPYLCHADVAVVPLQFESGTRFKILEAGACGIPIVSTVLGAEGIPVIHEQDILLADDPVDFANSIVRLIRDRKFANKLGGNCRKLVQEKYSVEYLASEAKGILQRFSAGKVSNE